VTKIREGEGFSELWAIFKEALRDEPKIALLITILFVFSVLWLLGCITAIIWGIVVLS
jgi:hypothetical protein